MQKLLVRSASEDVSNLGPAPNTLVGVCSGAADQPSMCKNISDLSNLCFSGYVWFTPGIVFRWELLASFTVRVFSGSAGRPSMCKNTYDLSRSGFFGFFRVLSGRRFSMEALNKIHRSGFLPVRRL